ncbi:hypothetical protein KVR01_011043 [Diaporthe batatas]|uniref:uncharacterized protein n=1 Tax=Diaporthe batatas TaxID=748121 RepID=UPI001D040928|nr:uncharacterized protein KVR01_011043 [Diaporthe batatas]KAG8159382.1 hypothetical protein KVR01_011043 [Diaporthe batatas]
MSEPTPVLDPPVENAPSLVETDGAAPAAATTDNGGAKKNNGQDVTMAGLEGSGVKAAKAGAGAEPVLAGSNNAPTTTASSSTNPPTPNRTATPTGSKESVPARLENNSSRAASAAPADRTADRVTMPTEPAAHGAPTRQYLNSRVTYHVMEGMKIVAKDQPADPLRVLGEFLLQRSADLERASTAPSGAEGDKEKIKENGADTSITDQ